MGSLGACQVVGELLFYVLPLFPGRDSTTVRDIQQKRDLLGMTGGRERGDMLEFPPPWGGKDKGGCGKESGFLGAPGKGP